MIKVNRNVLWLQLIDGPPAIAAEQTLLLPAIRNSYLAIFFMHHIRFIEPRGVYLEFEITDVGCMEVNLLSFSLGGERMGLSRAFTVVSS